MKTIAWLYAVLFLLIIAGCGPHLLGKPETSVAPTPKEPPQNITITVPNWPVYAYNVDGAIMVLVVRDPKSFPVPSSVRFTKQDGSIIEMQMVKPEQPKEKTK